MSGHSKWSTIKHQKSIADAKKGKIFSKIAKAITIAVREGKSAEPENNPRLRLAIEQAKTVNMPKENIKRAIDRGLGKGSESALEAVVYEGYGPEKAALIIECITDNKNRTAAEIKSFFERFGGRLGAPGSVSYLFQKKGMILIVKEGDFESQALKLIDLGIDDFEESNGFVEVYTKVEKVEKLRQKIIESGFKIKESGLVYKPLNLLIIDDKEKKEKVLNFLNKLDEMDDVQRIFCNVDFQ